MRQLRRRARRLRDRADAILWGESQRAHSRGDHDDAEWWKTRAHALEGRADLRDAQAWRPRQLAPVLSDAERAELARVLDRLDAERARKELAATARRAEAERYGYGPRYFEAALEREVDRVRHAAVGDRNNTLASAAFVCARFVCEGWLTAGDVLDALVPASTLPSREAHQVVRSALRRRCTAA